MKIEKISDNQIRCTLTKEDLADRELKLSELAYGTDKAKLLFRDMMQQASYEFGFEANDIPLMIEAIPLSPECIILIITKVEDPDELDTRFSKFSDTYGDEDFEDEIASISVENGADDVLGLFKKIYEAKMNSSSKNTQSAAERSAAAATILSDKTRQEKLFKVFYFTRLDDIIESAKTLKSYFNGYNSLYKNARSGKYTLILGKSSHSPEDFNRICNILSEYGNYGKYSYAMETYLDEHNEILIKEDALQRLSEL